MVNLNSNIRIEGFGNWKDSSGTILKITDEYVSVEVEADKSGVYLFNRCNGAHILREGYLSGYRLPERILLAINEQYPLSPGYRPAARPEFPVEAYTIEEDNRRIHSFRSKEPTTFPDSAVALWVESLRDTQYPKTKPEPKAKRFKLPKK